MISQINASIAQDTLKSNVDAKENSKTAQTTLKQGDTSKIEQIKTAIESGKYKINLEALSQKIAQELL